MSKHGILLTPEEEEEMESEMEMEEVAEEIINTEPDAEYSMEP